MCLISWTKCAGIWTLLWESIHLGRLARKLHGKKYRWTEVTIGELIVEGVAAEPYDPV
jgi:hypothetical protein